MVFKVIPVSLRVSRGCFKEVSRVFQVYLYGVSRLLKNVARVFWWCFQMLQGCFNGIFKAFWGCYIIVSYLFQRCFKGASSKVKGWFKGISFRGCLEGVSRMFKVYSEFISRVIIDYWFFLQCETLKNLGKFLKVKLFLRIPTFNWPTTFIF